MTNVLVTNSFFHLYNTKQNKKIKYIVFLNKNKKSYILLQTSKSKLESIMDFEDKILNTKKNYQYLVDKATNQHCLNRTSLINQISTLNSKYALFEPIFVKISRQYNDDLTNRSTNNVKINHYVTEL